MINAFILVYPWDTHRQVPWQKKEKKKKKSSGISKNKTLTPMSISFSKHPPFVDAIYFRTYPPNTLPNVL
jgi:hypothetical protein